MKIQRILTSLFYLLNLIRAMAMLSLNANVIDLGYGYTFDEAHAACMKRGSHWHLPYETEDPLLKISLKMKKRQASWLALKRLTFKEWRWTNGRISTFKPNSDHPPKVSDRSKNCAVLTKIGRILPVRCGSYFAGVLCWNREKSVHSFCVYKRWYEAETTCQTLGMMLPVLENVQLWNSTMSAMNSSCHIDTYFIGLQKEKWLTIKNNKYSVKFDWDYNEPDESENKKCAIVVYMNSEDRLVVKSSYCTNKHSVICISDCRQTETETTSSPSPEVCPGPTSTAIILYVIICVLGITCITLSSTVICGFIYFRRRAQATDTTLSQDSLQMDEKMPLKEDREENNQNKHDDNDQKEDQAKQKAPAEENVKTYEDREEEEFLAEKKKIFCAAEHIEAEDREEEEFLAEKKKFLQLNT